MTYGQIPRLDVKEDQQQVFDALAKLNLCNCGTCIAFECLLKLLERAAAKGSFYAAIDDLPAHWGEFCANLLESLGILEHSGSIGNARLTLDGEVLLEFLRQHGVDDAKWPNWASEGPK